MTDQAQNMAGTRLMKRGAKQRCFRQRWLFMILAVTFILAACREEEPLPTSIPELPTAAVPAFEPEEPDSNPVQVAHYNLGETTIVQENFPEDSPFRNMPVRLDGVIGMPRSDQEHPVVLIMHGSHADCPGENVWPCSAEEEQENYEGFGYLVEALAKAGYVALSINVNAEHTFGFGESPPDLRTAQLIDLHLRELAAANAGQSDKLGLDLTGRVDLARMTWLGHSRGGEVANRILREHALSFGGKYGPVQGLIQVAPAVVFADSLPAADVALATILPVCDQDVLNLEGQGYYESARLDPERKQLATSVFLNNANHNGFNMILEPERPEPPDGRPDCTAETMLDAETQQKFLTQYTIDFLLMLYGDPESAEGARDRLGIQPIEQDPENLYGLPASVNFLPAPDERLMVIQPRSDAELTQNLLGGEVRLAGLTARFCPEGYYVPNDQPSSEPCKRVNFNQPGYPRQFVFEWTAGGAEWRTILPEDASGLTQYAALQLRAALDPLSDLNQVGRPQSFTVELVDANGQTSQTISTAIAFPEGVRRPNEFFDGDFFTGQVYMRTLRVPLSAFENVDLSNIVELALLFDQEPTGTLFIANLELAKTGGS